MHNNFSSTAIPDPNQRTKKNVSPYHSRKAIYDRLLGMLFLFVSAPLIFILVVLVRATSRGAGIYKQTRVGKDGLEFSIYKIRTMFADAEACGTPQWTVRKDARITPLGHVLRYLHLDELPQLFNIALGEMSLTGPRPERPEFVDKLSRCVPHYLDRLTVLPGVTGLAQINLPPDESLESVRKKVILDCDYIQNATLGLDLRIFFCTLVRMLGLRHGVAPKLFRVERCFSPEKMPVSSPYGMMGQVSPIDDSAINIPSLIKISPNGYDDASGTQSASEEQEMAYVASTSQATESTQDIAEGSTSAVPRNPR